MVRPTEISLFCDAGETSLLASVFTAGGAKERGNSFDDFASALGKQNSGTQGH